MAVAISSKRSLIYAMQSVFGTVAATTGASPKYVRRSSMQPNHSRNVISSAEKRKSAQKGYQAHGLNVAGLTIDGELYPNSWTDLFKSLLGRSWSTVTAVTAGASDGFTISSGVLTRAAGGGESFITDGFYRGMLVRITNTAVAGNEGRDLLITAVTATTLTLLAPSGAAVADQTSDTNATLTVTGKVNYIPTDGVTDYFLTFEDNMADLDISTVYQDQLVGQLVITMNPNQIVTLQWSTTGSGVVLDKTGASAPHFADAGAPACGEDGFATTRGYLLINGSQIVLATALTITINWALSAPEVAFSQSSPTVARNQTVEITGTGGALKSSNALRTLFTAETEAPIILVLQTVDGNSFAITLPRCKFNSNSVDDGANVLTESFTFEALEQCGVSGDVHSSILVQDTSA